MPLRVSLLVAAFATLLSVFIGTLFVVASVWKKTNYTTWIFYGNILLPEIVMAIGILSIYTFFQIPLGYLSLITGHTIIGLGFVIPVVRARFIGIGSNFNRSVIGSWSNVSFRHLEKFYYHC